MFLLLLFSLSFMLFDYYFGLSVFSVWLLWWVGLCVCVFPVPEAVVVIVLVCYS